MNAELRNISTLSLGDLTILTEALQEKVIKEDRSSLPGHIKANRARFRLLCRLNVAKYKKMQQAKASASNLLEFAR